MKEYLIFIAVPIIVIGGGSLLKWRWARKSKEQLPDK
jgi:hypothetical protein